MTDRTIARMKFGSHLYGTATPASDLDFKSVFVPNARSILLQQVKGAVNQQREKNAGEKNVAGDIDEEKFSLQRFLGLAAEGQTIAIDMLFAPDWAMIGAPEPEWREIMENRHRLLTSRSAAFVGYARTQANKFGVKGSRVAASRAALAFLNAGMEAHGTTAKLVVLSDGIEKLIGSHEHMATIKHPTPAGGEQVMWEVCDRKMPLTASIKNAFDMMTKVVNEYGKRALMAETQEGVDWKALSHAVRVADEAIELLSTGHVTFPLPRAVYVTDVKLGRIPYRAVADEIDDLLVKVEAAAAASPLPLAADLAWIDDFVERSHLAEIRRSCIL
jgi:hypothetical protein